MADEQQEQLLRRAPAPAAAAAADIGFSWLTLLGFAFLTFNSAMAIYRSDGDPAAIGFVAFSYVDLVLLFVCLRWYEREAPGSATRGKLKVGVWILTTLLTMAFSYKVAAIMPLAVKVVIWAMACATVLGGFYGFFVYTEKELSPQCLLPQLNKADCPAGGKRMTRKGEKTWRKFDGGGPFLTSGSISPRLSRYSCFPKEKARFGPVLPASGFLPPPTYTGPIMGWSQSQLPPRRPTVDGREDMPPNEIQNVPDFPTGNMNLKKDKNTG